MWWLHSLHWWNAGLFLTLPLQQNVYWQNDSLFLTSSSICQDFKKEEGSFERSAASQQSGNYVFSTCYSGGRHTHTETHKHTDTHIVLLMCKYVLLRSSSMHWRLYKRTALHCRANITSTSHTALALVIGWLLVGRVTVIPAQNSHPSEWHTWF